MRILELMWLGFWQGVGGTVSLLVIFLVWLTLYHRHGHKFDTEHFIHRIHDFFTT